MPLLIKNKRSDRRIPPSGQTAQPENGDAPTANPLASKLKVNVSIPKTINIRLVDASTLGDYEVWFFISSILGSGFIGFIIAFLQNTAQASFGYMTILIAILFIVSLRMTFGKRKSLLEESETETFKVERQS